MKIDTSIKKEKVQKKSIADISDHLYVYKPEVLTKVTIKQVLQSYLDEKICISSLNSV
jgi:hypothetical protein